jgi:hypothetical protein
MLISHNVDWNLSTMVDRGPADGCGNFASRAAHPRIVLGVKLLLRGKVRWTNSDVETISPKAINAFRTLSRTRHARPSLPYVPVRRLYSFGARRWLADAVATLQREHNVNPSIIPVRVWRQLYIQGRTPDAAADRAAVSAYNVRTAADRVRKR